MYVKVTNGVAERYSIAMLKRDNPGISFRKEPPLALLADYSVYPCNPGQLVEMDELTQTAHIEYQLINNQWHEVFIVSDREV